MASDVTKDLVVDKDTSHILWAQSPIAIHSHHYHFQLQYTLALTEFIDGGELTHDTARWTVETLLRNKFGAKPEDPKAVLEFASGLFQAMGFGKLNFDQATKAEAPSNMYDDGWTADFGYRKARGTKCDFVAGFTAGALNAAYARPYDVSVLACKALGHPRCIFEVKEAKDAKKDVAYDTSNVAGPPIAAPPPGLAEIPHGVNEAGIIDAVLGLPLMGDASTGLAKKFGVLVNWTPQQFYSALQYRFIKKLAEYDLGLEKSAEELLFFDGEACALNTFHGITRSEEWNGLIKPMLQKPGDAVVALAAVANCLGWGKIKVMDLSPGEGVKVHLYKGEEALGYRALYGISDKPRSYAFSGAVRALMEVFLPGEVVESKFGRFRVKETKCIAKGDPYSEFIAERAT